MSISGVSVLSFGLGVLLLLPPQSPDAVAETKITEKLDGYGGYKFGMTLAQADAVRSDDVVKKPCDYAETEACIEREVELFGEAASIAVLISSETRTVRQINITFSRTSADKMRGCKKVLSNIAGPLAETFGGNYRVNDGLITWYFPLGGQVTLSKFCLPNDYGVVVVSYKQSDGFN